MKFPNQDRLERRIIGFDFAADLAFFPNVTIESAVFSISVVGGSDPDADNILVGSPTVAGTQVTQMRSGGISGVTYKIRCDATLSDSQIMVQTAELKLVTE